MLLGNVFKQKTVKKLLTKDKRQKQRSVLYYHEKSYKVLV